MSLLATISIRQLSTRWHKKLGWWGAVALLFWGISGISHPLMSWLGPTAEKFYPPRLSVDSTTLTSMKTALANTPVSHARVVKVVPSQVGAVLQITESFDQPRRYFSLAAGEELPQYDQEQAKWLASYYTGRETEDIESIRFQTEFDNDYPWVNRPLPVYHIRFKDNDQLNVYIHTETNALAGLNNRTKARLQTVFQTLHTWNWLDVSGHGRVIIVALLILCLFAMAATGLAMVLALKQRHIPAPSRRWHRFMSYALWLPLLGWSASGFYHLLQSAYVPVTTGLTLAAPIDLHDLSLKHSLLQSPPQSQSKTQQQVLRPENTKLENISINALSLVEGENQQPLYRLSVSPQVTNNKISREQRYQGKSSEKQAIYINVNNGELNETTDSKQAQFLATRATGLQRNQIEKTTLVTHFGPNYDFHNKRLPVWQIDFIDTAKTSVFIDPTTATLVEQNRRIDRAESWSFSLLHKWNHLTPLMGRFNRDLLIIVTLLFCLISGGFGIVMLLRARRRATLGRLIENRGVSDGL